METKENFLQGFLWLKNQFIFKLSLEDIFYESRDADTV